MAEVSLAVLLVVLVAAGGLWRLLFPRLFWCVLGFSARQVRVRRSWPATAEALGLARRSLRWRWRDGRPARLAVPRAPRLGVPRPNGFGWVQPARLGPGQTPADFVRSADGLAHAWRALGVRLAGSSPGRVRLAVTVRDPLVRVDAPRPSGGLLAVRVGRLETGAPWVMDFRAVPHWLIAGVTQSGKSTLVNALVFGLAAQPVALVGFDLKGGLEFTPYERRLSALATDRAESSRLLRELVGVVLDRMRVCRAHRARSIWALPEGDRPVPVVALVDEVAELFLMASTRREDKEELAATATAMLRLAQLGRALGVYLVVAGQRVGSDLGPGVTALRSQLTGRVCHRVNDEETAKMTLGDRDPEAVAAVQAIPPEMPGVAVVSGADGRWHRARSARVEVTDAENAATRHAHRTPAWVELTRARRPQLDALPEDTSGLDTDLPPSVAVGDTADAA